MRDEVTTVFGIETTVRELDSRLVLASLHARRGRRVFLVGGQSGQRIVREMKGAVFVGKHIIHPSSTQPRAYFAAKENDFVIVHLAEEGAIFQGSEPDWDWDLDDQLRPKLLDPEDYVCTWGNYQRDYYQRNGAQNPDNFRTTGHPRFDVLKAGLRRLYEDEAAELRQRYGDFVILCSNFSFANDAEGPWNTFSKPFGYEPEDEEQLGRFLGRWSHTCKTFPEFIEVFHKLARRRRDVNFVVRPHPSDNVKFFRHAFAGVPNVHVTQEKSVIPWLMAARCMLHAGCTTAVEAQFLGCPIVNFRPLSGAQYDYFLPNLFGAQASTQDQAIDAIETALSKPREEASKTSAEIPERAHNIFANFRMDSMNEFLGVLREAEALARKRPGRVDRARIKANELKAIAVEEAKHTVRRAFLRQNYLTAMHNRQRFNGFNREAIARRLAKLRELTGNPLEATYHSKNVLELTSTKAPE